MISVKCSNCGTLTSENDVYRVTITGEPRKNPVCSQCHERALRNVTRRIDRSDEEPISDLLPGQER